MHSDHEQTDEQCQIASTASVLLPNKGVYIILILYYGRLQLFGMHRLELDGRENDRIGGGPWEDDWYRAMSR
jgi:hypothetical protein